jgi:hypothetical protein
MMKIFNPEARNPGRFESGKQESRNADFCPQISQINADF